MKNNKIAFQHLDDYTHSSNALFHFMNKFEFLETILRKRAIFPRYCVEDINYLDISVDGVKYEKIAIIQK